MATGLRTISIKFVGDTKGLGSAAAKGTRQLDGFRKKADGLKTAFAGGFLGGFAANVIGQGLGAVKTFFGESISGWRDHQKIMAQTAQVVRSTGNAAQVSAKHVGALSDKIEQQTGVDGDLIQNGANLLLTFTNIKNGVGKNNQIFDRATQTITDMSAALGQDTKSSALQLGKALNDPIKGVSALQRVGVSFTAGQKKQIATLVKSGHTMGAQKLILKELGKEFGGSAKSQMTASDRMKVALRSLQDQIGKALVPVIDKLTNFATNRLIPAISGVVTWLTKNGDTIKYVVTQAGPFVGFILAVIAAIKAWTIVQGILNAVMALNPITLIIVGIAVLIAGIAYLATKTRFFQTIWAAVWGFMKKIGAWFAGPFVGFFTGTWHKITSGVSRVKNWIVSKWHAVIGWIKGVPGRVWGHLKNLWAREKRGAAVIRDWIKEKWNAVVRWVKGLPGRVWAGLRNLWDREKRGMQVIASFFVSSWRRVVDFIRGIPAKIRAFFATAKRWLLNAGRNIIAGLRSGVSNAMSGIKNWLKAHVWNPIVNGVKSLFGIHSPSTVFAGFGKNMILGLVQGMIRANPVKLVKTALGGISGGIAGLWAKLFGGQGGGNAANMALGKKMAATLYGWTGGQWDALRALWIGESGWNNNAQNPTSSAYGIAQFLNSTWGSVGARKTSDPAGQIAAGLKYIRRSYGSPANAYSKWLHRSPHWYEKGTAYVPHTGPAVLHQGEMVLPADVAEAVRQGVSGPKEVVIPIYIGDEVVRVVRAQISASDGVKRQRGLAGAGANR